MVPILLAAVMCSGADPAIVAVRPSPGATDANNVAHFKVGVTVSNLGSKPEANDTVAGVVMYQDGQKTDSKGLRPLRAGASQTVTFTFERSALAEASSTGLRFVVQFVKPNPPGDQDCNPNNDTTSLDV